MSTATPAVDDRIHARDGKAAGDKAADYDV
jgi:hypothetical protein